MAFLDSEPISECIGYAKIATRSRNGEFTTENRFYLKTRNPPSIQERQIHCYFLRRPQQSYTLKDWRIEVVTKAKAERIDRFLRLKIALYPFAKHIKGAIQLLDQGERISEPLIRI